MSNVTAAGAGVATVDPPAHLAVVPELEETVPEETVPEVPEVSVRQAPAVEPAPLHVVATQGEPVAPPVVDLNDPVSALREEFRVTLADIEWRLAQAYEQRLRNELGRDFVDMVTVEDINDGVHRMTGYTLTNNTPTGGITWASLHVLLKGIDYTVADGSTTNKYVWFIKANATSVTATTANMTLVSGNTMPVLGPEDALIFVNAAGVGKSVLEESVPSAVQPGSITADAFAADVNSVLSLLRTDVNNAQATADGQITSYVQNDPPWPAGADAPGANNGSAKTGDIWYDSNDGGAFRWSGPTGSPVNTWVRIADTDVASLAAKVGTRTTTYISASTAPPVAPAAQGGVPAGFAVGDLWLVTDQNNLPRRWSGSAWVDVQFGDAAISGIGGAKVGTGINGTNITTGTVVAARVGTGVNGAILTTATGTVGSTQIANAAVGSGQLAASAVTPVKMNTGYHQLY